MLHPNRNDTESMEKAEKKRIKRQWNGRGETEWASDSDRKKKKTVNETTVKKGPKIYDQNKICHT